MLQDLIKNYFIIILYGIIHLNCGISQEYETTGIVNASNTLPRVSTENVDVSYIFPDTSQDTRTTESVHTSNISPGISNESESTGAVNAFNIFPDTSQEIKTTDAVNASNILPGISNENRTAKDVIAFTILSSISQENETTEVGDALSILSGTLQKNRTMELVHESNISLGISQENRTAEVVSESDILHDILRENRTIEVVNASGILPDASRKNRTMEVVSASDILPDTSRKNRTMEVVSASDILPDTSRRNRTMEVVSASDILPDTSRKNRTMEVVSASDILPDTSRKNRTMEVVSASNILPDTSRRNRAKKVVSASDILPRVSTENGTSETTDLVSVSDILPSTSQENGITEAVDLSITLPSTSKAYRAKAIVDTTDTVYSTSRENVTAEIMYASNISQSISKQGKNADVVQSSSTTSIEQKCKSKRTSCYDLRKFVGMECKQRNKSFYVGIENFSSKYDVYSSYILRVKKTKYLPARAFVGFCIEHLGFDDPELTVDENVFHGIVELHECIVRRSSIKIIPDFRTVKDSITNIFIKSSRLTALEGENLQNLTLVKDLSFFNNSIRFIDPDVFKGTENIEKLDLSRNHLITIPPMLLDPMKKLDVFNAASNNLQRISRLFLNTKPRSVYLYSNNITTMNIYSDGKRKIENLYLSGNKIKQFPLSPNWKNANLGFYPLQQYLNQWFYEFNKLVTLDLSYNFIGEDLDAFSDGCLASCNRKSYGKFESNSLNLIGNKLRSLDEILRYKQFAKVKASQNRIEYLTHEDFLPILPLINNFPIFSIKNIEIIELQENQIGRIDTDTFKPLRNYLKKLDLSSNLITSLNGSVRYLPHLRMLNLTNNLIQFFANDEFQDLIELVDLHLQHNQIKNLWQFQQLPRLQHLSLTHNDIKLVNENQVPKTLKFMALAENPLKCDCSLPTSILQFKTQDSIITGMDICLQPALTSSLHKNSNCPDACTCGCTSNRKNYFMSVDCSSKNLSVIHQFLRKGSREIGDNSITYDSQRPLVMKQNVQPSLHIEDRVLGINLENNSLESLEDFQLPPNLTQLYLANNKLRWFPDSVLDSQKNLNNVSLSGNPWSCDCNASNFKKWLTTKQHIIQDIDNVRCGVSDKGNSNLDGEVISMLSDFDLCPSDAGIIISASISASTFVILCLTAKILYGKYQLRIKLFLYSHGFTFVKRKYLDYDKMFDAFLSFSHKDDEFVIKEIISEIEDKDPSIRLCIHYRHFMPGEFINNNIINAVQNSKMTLIILSKHFLESEWCLAEFRIAYVQSLEDKVHRIIVVKVGDLPEEIDPTIKIYLCTTTYLTWGEKNFWNKLLYILPNESTVKIPFQQI